MQKLADEVFSLEAYQDETIRAVARYVLIILYLAILLGFGLVVFNGLTGSWTNLVISALITVVCAYSLVLIRSGRLNESVLVPAFFTISGIMLSVTLNSGLSDPGVLLLFPLLGVLTIFIDKIKLTFIGFALVSWIFLIAFLTANGYYLNRTTSVGPYGIALVVALFLMFSLALYRLTYKQVLVINQKHESDKQAAEQANDAKSNFLATMSHELRTPLNAVIGYSDAILEEVAEDGFFIEDHMEDLERIKRAGQDLLHMINGILDLSKIEENQMSVHLSTFSALDVCQEAVSVVKPMADQNVNQLVFSNKLKSPRTMIRSDQTKVRQILINLLSNAAKYTEGGRIELEVSNSILDANSIIFRVIDNGLGIPEEMQPLIFDAFQQVDGSFSRSFSGTGLGLTISKKLTRLIEGDLRVQSKVNVGSIFILQIPIQLGKNDGDNEDLGLEVFKQQVGESDFQQVFY